MGEPGFRFVEDERCRFRPVRGGGLRLVLRLTGRCDLSCPHCLAETNGSDDELDTASWLVILRQLPDIGAVKALLTGGEPLLRPDLVRFVETLAQAGIVTDLNSNLQRMTRSMMRDLKRAGLAEISVSIEGPERVHDRMHGRPGAYGRLLEAIGWAEELSVAVDASCCLTRENERFVADLVEAARDWPIRSLTFSRLLPIGHGGASRLAVPQRRLTELYAFIRDGLAASSSIPVRATGLLGAPRPVDCGRGDSLAAIAPDGRLLGCALSAENPYIPHPLEAGLRPAYLALREELAVGTKALCWRGGD